LASGNNVFEIKNPGKALKIGRFRGFVFYWRIKNVLLSILSHLRVFLDCTFIVVLHDLFRRRDDRLPPENGFAAEKRFLRWAGAADIRPRRYGGPDHAFAVSERARKQNAAVLFTPVDCGNGQAEAPCVMYAVTRREMHCKSVFHAFFSTETRFDITNLNNMN